MTNLKVKFHFIIAMIFFLFPFAIISKAANDFEKLPIQLNPSLAISQLYVGGGAANALFKNDFVELHNKSSTPVALGGKSIQVSTATGNFLGKFNLPNVSIVGGGFYLIQFGSDGNNGVILPTPDASSAILLPMNAGKAALVNSTNTLSCGSANLACSSTQSDLIVDLVAYGSVGGITEGTSLATLNEANVARRNPIATACTDSNNNNNDFSIGKMPENVIYQVSLQDLTGRTLQNLEIRQSGIYQIGTSQLAQGIYLLKVEDSFNTIVYQSKLVITH